MKILRYIFAFGVLAIIGCSSGDITSANDVVFPADSISFGKQVEPLFAVSCNMSGCHSSDSPAGGVDLTTWYGVRDPVVISQPGDTSCNLLLVVYGKQFHNGPINLNNNHRQGLKQWVIEGARNN
jgi:hypothetical protein